MPIRNYNKADTNLNPIFISREEIFNRLMKKIGWGSKVFYVAITINSLFTGWFIKYYSVREQDFNLNLIFLIEFITAASFLFMITREKKLYFFIPANKLLPWSRTLKYSYGFWLILYSIVTFFQLLILPLDMLGAPAYSLFNITVSIGTISLAINIFMGIVNELLVKRIKPLIINPPQLQKI